MILVIGQKVRGLNHLDGAHGRTGICLYTCGRNTNILDGVQATADRGTLTETYL